MRARRYYQRTQKKININGIDTAGYDKSKTLLPKQCWLLMELVLIRTTWQMRKSLPTWLLWLSQIQRLICTITIDLSNSGLKEFQQPEFEGYGFKANKDVCENFSNEIKKTTNAPIIEDWVSDYDEDDSEVMMVQKPALNNMKKGTGQRGVRPVWNNAMRVKHQNFSNSRRNFVPTAVLTKSGIVPVSAARPINTDAPKSFVNVAKTRPNAFQKSHSLSRRPFYQQTTLKNKILNDKVNIAKVNSVNTAKGNRVTSPQHVGFGDLK
ncbi:hypothetical protein Tco_1080821 [Tanacetum coccineum]|uniref:Uncharacterized protein n=1 Tax=Tanacetum coccineum TaxID=301880 RepID=A0ABQ5HWX7_9ASTR